MTAGLKRRDITPCAGCGRGLAKGRPLVYRLHLDRFALDQQAIQRETGLELQLGVPLATVFSPDPEIAKHFVSHTFLVCGDCIVSKPALVLVPDDGAREDQQEARA